MNFIVAVDFSSSNIDKRWATSLHSDTPDGPSQYQQAIEVSSTTKLQTIATLQYISFTGGGERYQVLRHGQPLSCIRIRGETTTESRRI